MVRWIAAGDEELTVPPSLVARSFDVMNGGDGGHRTLLRQPILTHSLTHSNENVLAPILNKLFTLISC